MTGELNVWETTAIKASGVAPGSAAASATELRANIMGMTQTAEDAVLRPAEPGRWSHGLRAALAGRIARLNDCPQLAAHYLALPGASDYQQLADPDASEGPADLQACLCFVDRVATQPGDITADDILVLQDAGVSDADIVRLSELNAFLGYQIRLVVGLSLLSETETGA
ncbi:MAG: hypothetical protein AAF346_15395 [Pseudomonadota bacterium]